MALEPAQAINTMSTARWVLSLIKELKDAFGTEPQPPEKPIRQSPPERHRVQQRPAWQSLSSEAPLREGLTDWQDQQFCVLDVETTGLSPRNGDRVVEIALVRMQGHRSVISEWSTRLG